MSAIGVTQIQSSYTAASPLVVPAGNLSASGASSYVVQNIGQDVVWCRLTNVTAATTTNWARSVPGQRLVVAIAGTGGQVLTLDMYLAPQSYRFIPMNDFTYAPVSSIGRVEIIDHEN